jgi:hypothetical protein
MAFAPVNDIMSTVTMADVCGISGLGSGGTYDACRFFQPNATGGQVPQFTQFTRDSLGYNIDWNNLAPNIGVAWRPNVKNGWLRALLGDPEQATLRGGYSVAYDRQGLGVFTGVFGRQYEPDPQRDPRRLAVQRRGPHPGAHAQLRERPVGRHDGFRPAEDVQGRYPRESGHGSANTVHAAG